MSIKRLSDGIIFQFLMVGALSFSHIHDVVAVHGQAGWKAWLYPPSVDLLTVAAYRKILAAHRDGDRDGMAWCAFLLGLAASLAANVVDAWGAVPSGLVLAVAIGVWPAVALLVCTMLGHSHPAPAEPVTTRVEVPAVPAPSSAPVVSVQVTNQVAAVTPAPAPAELPAVPAALLDWARTLADQHQAEHGAPLDLTALRTRLGPRVGEPLALAIHRALGSNEIEAA